MMKSRSEAVLIRNRGGKLLEVRFICDTQSKNKFDTDNLVEGSMETKLIPPQFAGVLSWLHQSGRLREVEEMLRYIFQ